MKLYTLIINFDGGIFVTQAMTSEIENAPSECIKEWDIENIITEQDKDNILSQLKEEDFILLKEIKNVWFGSVMLNNKLLMLNLVLTNNAT